MSDLCQPQYRILWARCIKDDEGDGQSLITDGPLLVLLPCVECGIQCQHDPY